jgi:hypothetical protein
MSVDARILAVAERFLSPRTVALIVAPALADLQFECTTGRLRRAAHYWPVLRALAGALCEDAARASSGVLLLTLLPAGYHIFLLLICFDVFSLSISTDFLVVASLILLLSLGPVMVCIWPERRQPRAVE